MGGATIVPTAWAAVITVAAMAAGVAEGGIGVNWGTLASHPLKPSIVVNLLKDNGIKKVKLFDSDTWTVSSLAGSKIETIIGIPNDRLKKFAESYNEAKNWVKDNVTVHMYDGGVDIRYVSVGNEAFLTAYNGSFVNVTFPAMQNVQKALDEAGHSKKIKVTTALNADVYEAKSNLPSDGQFRPDIYSIMKEIVRFLDRHDAPFMVNIYPFLSLYQNPNFPIDYAFFGGSGQSNNDNGKSYTNVFDANYDTLIWSLKKVGFPNLKIVIGEVGWPTDANVFANVTLAKRFYDGLFEKLASGEGTPMRPKESFEVYLFGLLDENAKSVLPGFFERHWGIFQFDGKPKFPMDLSGKGNDKMLVAAKGVQYMERKWCVLRQTLKNLEPTAKEVDYACGYSDCTALTAGGSCGQLDRRGRISYAFNIYFQMQDQNVEACVFDGTAEIVTKNATVGNCLFPIQIVSGGERLKAAAAAMVGLVLSLFVLGL
ncbi:Glucan endo-1,3-beta-glucosidase 8 [Cucurbita argyrosperma subsp. argyrosperma]|uniref:glucan endo-1,3-beta-D-glucosidase n=1 Tax=Cucurbita moschata TaxID=3662 RepID=A0A6J1HE69_CUCMO|nr:glucan endo-1,3-beta-glucosidase 8-like [Cucurbita moschata]KAG7027111.1 Glucan endo-1,3-beta-glucosidase 8 [Cucurbita argyrosperma subsp. argyrosperma]